MNSGLPSTGRDDTRELGGGEVDRPGSQMPKVLRAAAPWLKLVLGV